MASPPFKVKAVHDYSSPHEEDLSFVTGDIITVTEEEDADWYVGEYSDASGSKKAGLFPRNFVERYEPAAPPRPTRTRPKKDTATEQPSQSQAGDADAAPDISSQPTASTSVETASAAPPAAEQPREPKPEPEPAKASTTKAPPAVSEKPSSFRDRIAAFNKTAAPPIAPKPAGAPSGQGFIKKPFVAPPPARNSYVPLHKEQPPVQKTYRRDEDPEIAEEQAQAQRDAEAAGLAGDHAVEQVEDEDAPKPTSLKDRIALLQKQQQEQAARRAETTAKERPKRPAAQPRTDSEPREAPTVPEAIASDAGSTRTSLDAPRSLPKPAITRMRSRDTQTAASIVSDGNDADQSGAGDTTEDAAEDESTEVDEPAEKTHARPPLPARSSTGASHERESAEQSVAQAHDHGEQLAEREEREGDAAEEKEDVDEDEDEAEEEEDVDPEVRRKMELRERMAKMSGGMGMPGMFAPMGMPMPGSAAPKRPKQPKEAEGQDTPHSPPSAPRVPMVPIPGMALRGSHPDQEAPVEKSARDVEDAEEVEPLPSTTSSPPGKASSLAANKSLIDANFQ